MEVVDGNNNRNSCKQTETKVNKELMTVLENMKILIEARKTLNSREEELKSQLELIMNDRFEDKCMDAREELDEIEKLKIRDHIIQEKLAQATATSLLHMNEIELAVKEKEFLQLKVETLEKEVTSLRQDCENAHMETTFEAAALAAARNDVAKLQKTLSEANSENVALRQMCGRSRTEAATLKKELDVTREELESSRRMARRTQLRYLKESKTVDASVGLLLAAESNSTGLCGREEQSSDELLSGTVSVEDDKESSSSEHVITITEAYNQLICTISARKLAVVMFQRNALTLRELESIQAKHETPCNAAKLLLNILLEESVEVYECFLDALKLTNDMDTYDWLLKIGGELGNLQNRAHADVIRQNYTFLRDNLDTECSGLVDQLRSDEVLDQSETEDIKAVKSSTRRNEKLLSMLSRKSADQFQQFLDALDKSAQNHVRNRITGRVDVDDQQLESVGRSLNDERGRHQQLTHDGQQTQQTLDRSSDTEIIQLHESLKLANENVNELKADVRSLQLPLKLSEQNGAHLRQQLERGSHHMETETRVILSEKQKMVDNKLAHANDTEKVLRQAEQLQAQLHQAMERECDLKQQLQQAAQKGDELQREIYRLKRCEGALNDELKVATDQVIKSRDEMEHIRSELNEAVENYAKSQLEIEQLSHRQLEQVIVMEHLMKNSVPRVVSTLPEAESVCGVTSLDDELYVLRNRDKDKVEVYSKTTYSLLRKLSVPGWKGFTDVTSCKFNRCLYISDHVGRCVHKAEPQGKRCIVTNWPVSDSPARLSVTVQRNVLVTCREVGKIKEFTTFGEQLRVISLQSDIVNPWHAIQLSNGQFVVSHGHVDDSVHRVCKVDANGHIVQSYGGQKGSATAGQLNGPSHLAVDVDEFIFVVDLNNYRMLLLSPTLGYVRQVVSHDKLKWLPLSLYLDINSRRLYVAEIDSWKDNQYKAAGRVVAIDL